MSVLDLFINIEHSKSSRFQSFSAPPLLSRSTSYLFMVNRWEISGIHIDLFRS